MAATNQLDPLASNASHGFRGAAHVVAGREVSRTAGHCHMDVELQCWDRPVHIMLAGRIYAIKPGSLVVLWAGLPHHLLATPATAAALVSWISVPLAWLQTWAVPRDVLQRLFAGAPLSWPTQRDFSPTMTEWIDLLTRATPSSQRIVALELQALLLRLHVYQPRVLDGPGPTTPSAALNDLPKIVLRALTWLCDHCREGGKVADAARDLGVSAPYLAKLFQQHVGQSLRQTMLDMRLIEAQRLLICSDDSVAQIALASGFGSMNRFFVAFRQRHGISPRQFRRQHATAIADTSGS